MILYVVRHGQIKPNVTHIIASCSKHDLTKEGIIQAEKARDKIKNIDYDIVFCSPLKRAVHTMEIINEKKVKCVFDDRLKERNAGILESKKTSCCDLDTYWNYYKNEKYENAESIKELFDRVKEFLEFLKKNYSDKKVLLVTHDGVCRTIESLIYGIPKDGNIRAYAYKNCEIRKYEI